MSYHRKQELQVPVLRLTSQLPLSTRGEQHRRFSPGDGKSKIISAMAAKAAAFAHTRPVAAVVAVDHILWFCLFILFDELPRPGDSEVTLRS